MTTIVAVSAVDVVVPVANPTVLEAKFLVNAARLSA